MVATELDKEQILLEMLMRTPGKAEIVNGRIVQYLPKETNPDTQAIKSRFRCASM